MCFFGRISSLHTVWKHVSCHKHVSFGSFKIVHNTPRLFWLLSVLCMWPVAIGFFSGAEQLQMIVHASLALWARTLQSQTTANGTVSSCTWHTILLSPRAFDPSESERKKENTEKLKKKAKSNSCFLHYGILYIFDCVVLCVSEAKAVVDETGCCCCCCVALLCTSAIVISFRNSSSTVRCSQTYIYTHTDTQRHRHRRRYKQILYLEWQGRPLLSASGGWQSTEYERCAQNRPRESHTAQKHGCNTYGREKKRRSPAAAAGSYITSPYMAWHHKHMTKGWQQ